MEEFVWNDGQIQFGDHSTTELIERFGSPLYLYDEKTLRARCREIRSVCDLDQFQVYYSAKANTSVPLLRIVREEGLKVDAMSTGEVYLEKLAGYSSDEILFVSNNVGVEDFKSVIEQKIRVCVDSLSQLETYCSFNPGGEAVIRLNLGSGAGHHQKVVTSGKVKFGILAEQLEEAFAIAGKSKVDLMGLMVHIGSFFLSSEVYLETVNQLLSIALKHKSIRYLDFGGGFGIPYDRKKQAPFPLQDFGAQLKERLENWMERTGRRPMFAIEPGRFVVGQSGVCLTRVQSVKTNAGLRFVGTDLGFNFLLRPEMYDAYHEIVHATNPDRFRMHEYEVVGNICESGDYLGRGRELPEVKVGDVLLIRDTGAYGYCMSSNYNSMRRPPELLLDLDDKIKLIRKRESFEDLSRNQIY